MPDLNSVPKSPHGLANEAPQQMPPPPRPPSPSLNILPSNQSTINQGATGSPSPLPPPHYALPTIPTGPILADTSMSSPASGPVRHPRPYTAADIHQELEKEQEGIVNRLTRELSILRASQNASTVSNTSSTSASTAGADNRRHNRTASNASQRSFAALPGLVSTSAMAQSVSSPAPVRPSSHSVGGISMSRQSSTTSRRSQAGSPTPGHLSSVPASLTHLNDPSLQSYFAQREGPTSSNITTAGSSATTSAPTATSGSGMLSPGIIQATSRYEETAFYREEMENVKRENEALKLRIRELERQLRERQSSRSSRRSSSTSRHRSESVSTTGGGGTSIAPQREERPRVVSMLSSAASSIGVGVPEEEVRVGESASNAGLGARG